MITIRKSNNRGRSQTEWLDSFHTFSFANYYDPEHMRFGNLRVINEDTVQRGGGFPKHPHHDMEIISYVVEGALEHQDSMDNGSVIGPGEIQLMTAGTGVEHSEFNHSKKELLHFLQIWILPNQFGLTPNYQQHKIPRSDNTLMLIGASDKKDGAVVINQDVNLYVAYLTQHHSVQHTFVDERIGWVQLIKGKIDLNDETLLPGDGAAIENEQIINIRCIEDAELLLFDLGKG